MRRLLYIAIGFAASCSMLVYVNTWLLRSAGIVGLLLLVFLLRKEGTPFGRLLFTLLGCLLGFAWFTCYSSWYLQPIRDLDGKTVYCSIQATDYSRETDYGVSLNGTMKQSGRQYPVTVYLDPEDPFIPGDCLEGDFRLRLTTESGENPSQYYQGKGIFLVAYQSGTFARTHANQSARDLPAVLRHRMGEVLQQSIPDDCVAFARALLLGDTSQLSYRVDTDLKISGIRHVVAVSGLHISIVFALISLISFKKRLFSAGLGLPLLFLFAAVAGFTPSVTRACVMCGLMLLAQLFSKEYDGPTALSFAVLVMLIGNPYVVSSVSFQLSVASVSGMFLFSDGIRDFLMTAVGKRKLHGWMRKLISGVCVTVSAQIFTIPLCAYYFGMVSLAGILTNLLVLWAVSLIFCLLTAICLTALVSPALAGMIGVATAFPIRYVLLVARYIASFSLSAVYTASPYITAWLVFAYLLLGLFFACGKRKPGTFFCCCTLGLCIALMASWYEPVVSDVSFTMLDVGQGQSLLLQVCGRTYVVDCGGDSDDRTADVAAEALLSRGYTRVDALILTHLDRDHAGAAENFMSRIETDLLIAPYSAEKPETPGKTRCVYAESDLQISDAGSVLTVFAPVYQGSGNEMSLCVLFETEKCDILITGDRNGFGERSLLRNAQIPDVDILVAGHHGARDSTCEELLKAVRPEIVCISVGQKNPYGHPAQELLQRLEGYGCTVYRTDLNGTITIRR